MSRPIEAIPTVYRGVQMRSRAEADMARLLDLLKMPWQYEATSVLLPNGQHYRPDFSVAREGGDRKPIWVEVRGRDDTESLQQIHSVARFVASGHAPVEAFFTVSNQDWLGPLAAAFYGNADHAFYSACETRWFLSLCRKCARGWPTLHGFSRSIMCPFCYWQDNIDVTVAIVGGYVSVRNPDSWRPETALRVRDLPDDADLIGVADALPMDTWEP